MKSSKNVADEIAHKMALAYVKTGEIPEGMLEELMGVLYAESEEGPSQDQHSKEIVE